MAGSIDAVWNQKRRPVVWRASEAGEKSRVRLPYRPDNKEWLKSLGKTKPAWNGSEWILPRSWFNRFVDAALDRYAEVYIIQPYNEMEICAPACRNAKGHECQCSCMGQNHGAGDDGRWFDISETLSMRWQGKELASRLLTKRPREHLFHTH